MSRRCECCKLRFYVHHYKWHICTGLTQPTTTLAEPIGDFSVASGTSEYTHNEEERDALVQMRENLSTALANVQSRIPQIFSEPPTRSLSEESTETQITTSRVIPAPSNPYVNVTEEPNEPSYLKDRNCKSSVRSQTSCVQQVKPKETRPSGSKKKPGERTSKAPESATRERAVSISASANSGEMSFAEATRLMFPSAQSTSSSHLRETSTQETTRASVPTTSTRSPGHRSLRTPQETRPSGSKQKPGEGTSKAPESATRERAVSMSVSENSGGMTFAEATRLMFPSAQSTSSSHLRETLTQEPTTASVPTTSTCLAGRASFRTPRVSSEQAATSGSGLGAEMFVGGPVGSASRGANTDPMLSAQLDDKSLKHYCGLCNKYFDNWVDLDAHIEILKEEGVKNAMVHYYSPTYFAKDYFACMFCNHRFDRQIDLNSHVKAKHQAPTPYKCIYCNKAFQNKESLSNHGACTSSIHLRNTPQTARTSVQKTSTRLELVGSTSRGASAVPMPNALFNNAKSTNAKSTNAKSTNAKSTNAKSTNAKSTNAKSTNAKCTKYYCKLCNKYFDKLMDLDAHIDNLLAKGVENAMAHNHSPSYFKQCYFRCMFCERTFDRQIDLDFHRRAKHQVRTPYKCIYCSMECQSRGGLSNHEAQKHKGITIHKCKKCHKRFFNENDLETHTCEIPEN